MIVTATLTHKALRALAPAEGVIALDHYLLSAYGSIEAWQQHIVVIVPGLEEPAYVLAPRARNASKARNRHALALPSLSALTSEMAAEVTHTLAPYFEARHWPREERAAGRLAVNTNTPRALHLRAPRDTPKSSN